MSGVRFAVVGDVHQRFDEEDVVQLDAGGYDAVLFVGDLTGYWDDGTATAAIIAKLRTRALVMPGNHDGVRLSHLAAETFSLWPLVRLLEPTQAARTAALVEALSPVPCVGYDSHDVEAGDVGVTVVAGRPHAMGGPRLSFAAHLERTFGVATMEASGRRLCEVVDGATHDDLVFLAHNGPTGLGASRSDIFGRDFHRDEGDWGDPDLAVAIAHAKATGRRVRAVVAGHMHHRLKGGGRRRTVVRRDGTVYVNAARVPRIYRDGDRVLRHHVALTVEPKACSVEPVVWPGGDDRTPFVA